MILHASSIVILYCLDTASAALAPAAVEEDPSADSPARMSTYTISSELNYQAFIEEILTPRCLSPCLYCRSPDNLSTYKGEIGDNPRKSLEMIDGNGQAGKQGVLQVDLPCNFQLASICDSYTS